MKALEAFVTTIVTIGVIVIVVAVLVGSCS